MMRRFDWPDGRSMVLAVTMLAIAGMTLSGCGRKGDPEIPGATPAKQTAEPKQAVEDKPFVLDSLL